MLLYSGLLSLPILAFAGWELAKNLPLRDSSTLTMFLFSLLLIAGLLAFSIFRAMRRQFASLRTLTLEVDGNVLSRRKSALGDLDIRRDEIGAILETRQGLLVRTIDHGRQIFVSALLEGFDELRGTIVTWHAPQPAPISMRRGFVIFTIVLVLATFMTMAASMNPWIVVPSGSALAALLLYSLIAIRRRSKMDPRVRRLAWMVALPLFGILGKIAVSLGFIQVQR